MIFSYLLIILIIVFIFKERILHFNSFFVTSILYLICFGVFPIIFISIEIPYWYYKGWLRFITPSVDNQLLFSYATFLSLLGYLLFLIGYKLSYFKPKELISFENTQSPSLHFIGIIFFIIGFLSFIIYLSSLGSIKQGFLSNNRMLFEDDRVAVQSSVSFLKQFSKIILSSTYILWALMRIRSTKVSQFFFLISFFCSLIYLFYSSGRLSLITFIFTFIISESILKNKIPYLKIVIATGVAYIITLFGKSIFRMFLYEDSLDRSYERMAENSKLTPFLDFIGEFSFPFLSFVRSIDINSEWLYFKDLIFWFSYAFPSKIFPSIESTSFQNTKNILGPTIDVSVVPSDILSYGYLNFGFIGIFLIAFLYGIVCKWIDSFKKNQSNPLSIIFSIALVFIISFRTMYFDPKHLVKGSFYYFLVLFAILVFIYFKRKFKIK